MTTDELRNIVAHIVIGFARKDEAESGINSAKPFVLKATWDSSSGEYSIADYDSTALHTAVNGGRVALLKFDNGNMADYTLVYVNSNSASDTFGGVSDGTLFSANLSSLNGAVVIDSYDVSDIVVIRSGAALGATAYQKPNGGIPKGDLSSTVQSSLSKADSALQSHQDLSSYATGAEYDSASKRIYLKHGSDRLTGAYVDATAFIKDGMVDNVTINSGYLVITFNTDSGKEPISLALTDIFNASNYYTKAEIDQAGYLTQESDPTVPSHVKSITQANITSWSGKQDTLVSGTNIKTVNNTSLLGSGNLDVKEFYTISNEDYSVIEAAAYEEPFNQPELNSICDAIKTAIIAGKKIVVGVTPTTYYVASSFEYSPQDYRMYFCVQYWEGSEQFNFSYGRVSYDWSVALITYGIDSTPAEGSGNAVTSGGVYTALGGKQDAIGDLADIRSGASKGATAYQKPSGGIPKSDLASAVQTSLGKADTALQSFTESDPTVPAWAKASSKPTYNGSEVKYTGTTGNVVTNNTTLNVAIKAIDDAIGNVETLLASI